MNEAGWESFRYSHMNNLLINEPNIREVIARDPMMDSPSDISKDQLKELGLEIKKKK